QTCCEEAAENLRMSNDQYRMSTCTLTDLLDAETLNRQAQNDLARAKAAYQIALSDYRRKAQ
ncbi:MAG: TolC family protein, partial [Bacteroidaceae bacterium]|nr:TolC family protein [Bacteroidaceae bacterium]